MTAINKIKGITPLRNNTNLPIKFKADVFNNKFPRLTKTPRILIDYVKLH